MSKYYDSIKLWACVREKQQHICFWLSIKCVNYIDISGIDTFKSILSEVWILISMFRIWIYIYWACSLTSFSTLNIRYIFISCHSKFVCFCMCVCSHVYDRFWCVSLRLMCHLSNALCSHFFSFLCSLCSASSFYYTIHSPFVHIISPSTRAIFNLTFFRILFIHFFFHCIHIAHCAAIWHSVYICMWDAIRWGTKYEYAIAHIHILFRSAINFHVWLCLLRLS